MSDAKIVVGQGAERFAGRGVVESPAVWKMIAPVGFVFLLVGLTDIGLSWFPMRFGTPEWEFGTIGTMLNNLPLPTLGLMILAGWAAVSGWKLGVRVFGVAMVLVGLFLVAMVLIYLLTLPPAWQAVEEVESLSAQLIAKKGIAKSLVQAAVYPVAYLLVGWRAWKVGST